MGSPKGKNVTLSAVAALFTAVIIGFVLWEIYPYRPADPIGWGILLLVGTPLYLILEFVGEWILIDDNNREYSKRSTFLVRGALFVIVFFLGGYYAWKLIGDWIAPHFEKW